MESLPPYSNNDSLVSMESPHVSKGDYPMSDDNLSQLEIDLPSADAVEMTEIITNCLKDVDCGKPDVSSLEMEHLSINDDEYNELIGATRVKSGPNTSDLDKERKESRKDPDSVEAIANCDKEVSLQTNSLDLEVDYSRLSKPLDTDEFLNDITEIILSPQHHVIENQSGDNQVMAENRTVTQKLIQENNGDAFQRHQNEEILHMKQPVKSDADVSPVLTQGEERCQGQVDSSEPSDKESNIHCHASYVDLKQRNSRTKKEQNVWCQNGPITVSNRTENRVNFSADELKKKTKDESLLEKIVERRDTLLPDEKNKDSRSEHDECRNEDGGTQRESDQDGETRLRNDDDLCPPKGHRSPSPGMYVITLEENSPQLDSNASSPAGSETQGVLRDRGCTSQKGSKPNSSQSSATRRILPKTTVTLSQPSSNADSIVMRKYPVRIHHTGSKDGNQICLEVCPNTSLSIPHVVHDVINEASLSENRDISGDHQANHRSSQNIQSSSASLHPSQSQSCYQIQGQNIPCLDPNSLQRLGHQGFVQFLQGQSSGDSKGNQNLSVSLPSPNAPAVPSKTCLGDIVIVDRHELEKFGVPYQCLQTISYPNQPMGMQAVQHSDARDVHQHGQISAEPIKMQFGQQSIPRQIEQTTQQVAGLAQEQNLNITRQFVPLQQPSSQRVMDTSTLNSNHIYNMLKHQPKLSSHNQISSSVPQRFPVDNSVVFSHATNNVNHVQSFMSTQQAHSQSASQADINRFTLNSSVTSNNFINNDLHPENATYFSKQNQNIPNPMPPTVPISSCHGNLDQHSIPASQHQRTALYAGKHGIASSEEISLQPDQCAQLHHRLAMMNKSKLKRLVPEGKKTTKSSTGKTKCKNLPMSHMHNVTKTNPSAEANCMKYQDEGSFNSDELVQEIEARKQKILSQNAQSVQTGGGGQGIPDGKKIILQGTQLDPLALGMQGQGGPVFSQQTGAPKMSVSSIEEMHLSNDLNIDFGQYIDLNSLDKPLTKVNSGSLEIYLNIPTDSAVAGDTVSYGNIPPTEVGIVDVRAWQQQALAAGRSSNNSDSDALFPNTIGMNQLRKNSRHREKKSSARGNPQAPTYTLPNDLQNLPVTDLVTSFDHRELEGRGQSFYGHVKPQKKQQIQQPGVGIPMSMALQASMSQCLNTPDAGGSMNICLPAPTNDMFGHSGDTDVSMHSDGSGNNPNHGLVNNIRYKDFKANNNIPGVSSDKTQIYTNKLGNFTQAPTERSTKVENQQAKKSQKKKGRRKQGSPNDYVADWIFRNVNRDWSTAPATYKQDELRQQEDRVQVQQLRPEAVHQNHQHQYVQQTHAVHKGLQHETLRKNIDISSQHHPHHFSQQHQQQIQRIQSQKHDPQNITGRLSSHHNSRNGNIQNREYLTEQELSAFSLSTPLPTASLSAVASHQLHRPLIPRCSSSDKQYKHSNKDDSGSESTASASKSTMSKSSTKTLSPLSQPNGPVKKVGTGTTHVGVSEPSPSFNASHNVYVSSEKEPDSMEYSIDDSDLCSLGSSASSMEVKRRWFESLGVDEEEDTPLHYLCDMPQNAMEKIQENKNLHKALDLLNNRQETALFVAVVKQNLGVVKFLVKNKANVNIACKSDPKKYRRVSVEFQTALHEAVEIGNVKMVKILLSVPNISVDSRRGVSSLTPLMLALTCHLPPRSDRKDVIELLLRHKASLEAQDVEGRTPLMYMVMSGDVHLVKYILKKVGVEMARCLVTAVTKKTQMTCLHYAAELSDRKIDRAKKKELLKLLIEHGAYPDRLNANKQSARHWASNEIFEVMSQLKIVKDGADGSAHSKE